MENKYAPTDDITIESEAMEQEVRPKLELGHLVPHFRLQDADGNVISTMDFKEKKNLVLFFFDLHSSRDWASLAMLKRRYHELADNNAEVLAITSGPFEEIRDCAASMDVPFPLLCDCYREATCSYCVTGTTLFVADRFGELKLQEPVSDDIDHIIDQAVTQLELAELECPECGVSTWPKY